MEKPLHPSPAVFCKTPLATVIGSLALAGTLAFPVSAHAAVPVTNSGDTSWRFQGGEYDFSPNLSFTFTDDKWGALSISAFQPGVSTASPSQTIHVLERLDLRGLNGTAGNSIGARLERRSPSHPTPGLYVKGGELHLTGEYTGQSTASQNVSGLSMEGSGQYSSQNPLGDAYAEFNNTDTCLSAIANPTAPTTGSFSALSATFNSVAIFNGNAYLDLQTGENTANGGSVLASSVSHVAFNGDKAILTGTSASTVNSSTPLYGAYVHGHYAGGILYEKAEGLRFNSKEADIKVTSLDAHSVYGIYTQNSQDVVTDRVKDFSISAKAAGDNATRSVMGIQVWHHGTMDIRAENTSISTHTNAAINSFQNAALHTIYNGHINIEGTKAVITSSGTNNGGVALYAYGRASDTPLASGVTGNAGNDITINADDITITSATTGTGERIAAYAYAEDDSATIHVNSDATGADQGKTVNVTGTIYSSSENGSNQSGKAFFNFGNENSLFTGRTRYWPENADGSEVNIGLTNNARWHMTGNSWVTTFTAGGGHAYVGTNASHFTSLAHDAADFTSVRLEVAHLRGTNGNFYLRADIDGNKADTVKVQNGTGSHSLIVRSHGTEPSAEAMNQYLARQETGNAAFVLGNPGGKVDAGVYLYELAQREAAGSSGATATEWFLKRTDKRSPAAEDEAALAGTAGQYALWHAQLTDLRTRLGEVRYGNAKDGVWVRGHIEKDRMDAPGSNGLSQDSYGASLGYDRLLRQHDGDQLFLGGNFRTAHADQRVTGGNSGRGDLNNYGINLYATLAKTSGFYADAVLSADYYHQNTSTHMLDGTRVSADHSTYGLGASLEVGRKFHFGEDAVTGNYSFIEPQAQLSYYWVKGKDFTASNGMKIDQDNGDSLTGRLGLVFGKKFHQGRREEKARYFQPYVKAGINHEFRGDQEVHINNVRFDDSLNGTRVYYGAGFDWQFDDDKRLYMQLDREEGSDFTREFHLSAGLRLTFD